MNQQLVLSLDELHSESEKDLMLDKGDLLVESIRTPSIFSKYSKMLSVEKLILKRKLLPALKKKEREVWEYYSGKAEPEVYASKPKNIKVLKQNMEKYLSTDEDLVKLNNLVHTQQEKIDTIERILKNVNDRQWIIRNCNETNRFMAGN